MAKARLRPMIVPILPPRTMRLAMTRVYRVIAVCTPVTVVPRSLATVAMDTFITDVSSVMRNWPVASVKRMRPAPACATPATTLVPDAPEEACSAITPPRQWCQLAAMKSPNGHADAGANCTLPHADCRKRTPRPRGISPPVYGEYLLASGDRIPGRRGWVRTGA